MTPGLGQPLSQLVPAEVKLEITEKQTRVKVLTRTRLSVVDFQFFVREYSHGV
jgi:hypothetical protein